MIANKQIWLPAGLSCVTSIGTSTYELAKWKALSCKKRVLILNLMPVKQDTEEDIVRTLAACDVEAQVVFIKIKGQKYKTTPQAHMDAFYLDFEAVEPYQFERMIITGAPLEQMPFEQVRYWPQLQHIMHWADTHVERTLYICWGAQAGLYEHYGIQKFPLAEKMFGIYVQNVLEPDDVLMRNLAPSFKMPNSRHTEVRVADIVAHKSDDLRLLALSDESGVGVAATHDVRRTFIVGHLEYNPNTLHNEYHRDLDKHLPIHEPQHYYDENGSVIYSWQHDAVQFYKNWVE